MAFAPVKLTEISHQIEKYRASEMSLDEFADWFRTLSRTMFGQSQDVLNACLAIRAIFSEFDSGELNEQEFKKELGNTVGD